MFNLRAESDRQILAADREYDELCQRRYTVIKLDQPIQRGWRRSYVLSQRAKDRRDRPFLEATLVVINTEVFHHNRSFYKRQGRSRKLVEVAQPLRPIPVYEWEQKRYPNQWFRYFRRELVLERNRHWQPYWVFIQPSLFELKVQRNWLTHLRQVDPSIETRLSEIDRWLNCRDRRHRCSWLHGRSHRRWNGREERIAECARRAARDMRNALKNRHEADVASSNGRRRFSLMITFFPGVAQQQRHSAQNGASAGATPAAGTICIADFRFWIADSGPQQRPRDGLQLDIGNPQSAINTPV